MKRVDHLQEALKTIKQENIYTIKDLFVFYKGCGKSKFYEMYPSESEEMEKIKEAIEDNKRKTCQSLKAKWAKSENATLQIALFKTICTDEERRKLAINYHDIEGEIDLEQTIIILPDNHRDDEETENK